MVVKAKKRVQRPSVQVLCQVVKAFCRSPNTSSVPGGRWILQGLEKLISRIKMSFKSNKSMAVVLKKREVVEKLCFFFGWHSNSIHH